MSKSLATTKKLPDSPGVYFFKKGKTILYIGKATSLRDRVKSYFASDLLKTRSVLIADMVSLADKVEFQKTDSVLEALILEASLIKKYQPKYNTKEKDNKSFNYVVVTDEDFPRVMTVRGRDLEHQKIAGELAVKYEFGPFTSGTMLVEALKIIRKIFPYRDSRCALNSKKSCFNYQIGLCPGTCIGAVTKSEYSKTIRNIKLFFEGKKGELVKKLTSEMKALAKAQKFEQAGKIKRQIFALGHIRDVSLIKRTMSVFVQKDASLYKDRHCTRIEAYDVAHLQGTAMIGVMVVIEDGVAKKSDYRMFKIRRKGINDIASLEEILERRLSHHEWPLPNLIVVDGGPAQLNIAKEVLKRKGFNIDLVAVTKNEKHKPQAIIGEKGKIKTQGVSILLANSEAHRFAIKYHRNLRSKNMFGK